jgi:hypothetical protein
VAEQGVWGDEDAEVGSDSVYGGQLAGAEYLVDDRGQSVGAALGRCAQVVPARWCHSGVQGGQQRRSGFGIQLSA